MTKPKWKRHRFTSNAEDYRPVIFPPPGPWWCSGYDSEDNAIIIAYLPFSEKLDRFWPEAANDDWTAENKITFTDRFPKPEWWEGEKL